MSEWNDLTVGMILDYIITFNNEYSKEEEEKEKVREATQSDFDSF